MTFAFRQSYSCPKSIDGELLAGLSGHRGRICSVATQLLKHTTETKNQRLPVAALGNFDDVTEFIAGPFDVHVFVHHVPYSCAHSVGQQQGGQRRHLFPYSLRARSCL